MLQRRVLLGATRTLPRRLQSTHTRAQHALATRPAPSSPGPSRAVQTPFSRAVDVFLTEEPAQDAAPLSEEELEMIYDDLLAVSSSEPAHVDEPQISEPLKDVVTELSKRFAAPDLQNLMPQANPEAEAESPVALDKNQDQNSAQENIAVNSFGSARALATSQSREELLERLQSTVEAAEKAAAASARLRVPEASSPASSSSEPNTSRTKLPIPLGIASTAEWAQLIRACVREDDTHSAERALDLMKRSGAAPPTDLYTTILAVYSRQGDVHKTESFLQTAVTDHHTTLLASAASTTSADSTSESRADIADALRNTHVQSPSLSAPLSASSSASGELGAKDGLGTTINLALPVPLEFRDLHVGAYLSARRTNSARLLAHSYENANQPVSIECYTRLIGALFVPPPRPPSPSSPSSTSISHSPENTILEPKLTPSEYRALAWDLYAHMRYVAHPVPSPALYALMISHAPHPARALDLWTEMTVDEGMEPTRAAYNAVILACARGGREGVGEGLRIGREMLERYRALVRSEERQRQQGAGNEGGGLKRAEEMRPDKETFYALLEGCKRIGDLPRARWILTEMIKAGEWESRNRSRNGGERKRDVGEGRMWIEEDVMANVFQVYATYRPPFRRGMVRETIGGGGDATAASADTGAHADVSTAANPTTSTESPPSPSPTSSSSSGPHSTKNTSVRRSADGDGAHHLGSSIPQSATEVLAEAQALWTRIIADVGAATRSEEESTDTDTRPRGDGDSGPFAHVKLTPHLLASYLSVYLAHAPLPDALALFGGLYEECKVRRNARAWVLVLERCAHARRADREERALRGMVEGVWSGWKAWYEQHGKDGGKGYVNPRSAERAWAAGARAFALANDLPRAVALLKEFEAAFPPSLLVSSISPSSASASSSGVGAISDSGASSHSETNPAGPTTTALKLLHSKSKTPIFSSSTSLITPRTAPPAPLVRLSTDTHIPDDVVPPHLRFRDVETVHHRLVVLADGRGAPAEWARRELGWLTWAVKGYEGNLKMRRERSWGTAWAKEQLEGKKKRGGGERSERREKV
ncbi:hypothetical protein BOTBODRAFT_35536 [Botryobasidium botryosum FD-172 SS1]|uniref:Pentacotripeptide-repeat region of PRORP domain-containing protein n=1 Tax=Botryobasidium botryosum (strain FD-172 SS1) TaxID=930990 RepID=A0A067MI42_BOTB1|nr:hypothetical protein BOTBODRAFT_35536 [Botryobasidium botryosum FD-172 SS1]